jgi:hypothetical protein
VSLVVLLAGVGAQVFAQSASTNYKVEETFFGTGGELDASSSNYMAKQSAGELTVGSAASNNYQFQGGFNTSDTPVLEFAVNGGTYDLGILDASAPGAVTATFTIRNYLSSGYVVTVNGTPPTLSDNTHTLTTMNSFAGSTPGTEQFGVNLADNSNPDVGANPSQLPDSTFSFGQAVAGYDTPNQFKFIDGDTIAFSSKSSGQTSFALSIIANVARETPAGQYGGKLNIQVVPTF